MRIFYFSRVPWGWAKQRPQFTAETLARLGDDVLYLALIPFPRARSPRFDGASLFPRLAVEEHRVLPFALRCPAVEYANTRLLRRRLARRPPFDVLVVTDPRHPAFLPASWRASVPIVYDCMDNLPLFYPPGPLRDRCIAAEGVLCRAARLVIASAESLADTLRRRHGLADERVVVVRNAAAADFLDGLPKPPRRPASAPNAEVRPARPTLLYVGTVAPWLDGEVLAAFGRCHPEVDIRLVGPVHGRPPCVDGPSNVILEGPVAHGTVAARMASADVLLLPFTVDDLIRDVDPVKMYEYAATGRPVVSSYWPELARYAKRPGFFFYGPQAPDGGGVDFAEAASRALAWGGGRGPDRAFLAANTWDARMADYRAALAELV